jgi:hypothetical protein
MTWRPSSRRQQPTRPKSEHRARGAGFTLGLIFKLTKIDRWFPVQIKEIADFEEELAGRRIGTRWSQLATASSKLKTRSGKRVVPFFNGGRWKTSKKLLPRCGSAATHEL